MQTALFIYTDGGARSNPGPSAVGVVVKNDQGQVLETFAKTTGVTTNNEAEYQAVIVALKLLLEKKYSAEKLLFFIDSRLIVEQLSGRFKIKAGHLQRLFLEVKVLEQKIGATIQYQHIKREKNTEADFLVNQALDAQK